MLSENLCVTNTPFGMLTEFSTTFFHDQLLSFQTPFGESLWEQHSFRNAYGFFCGKAIAYGFGFGKHCFFTMCLRNA